MKDTFNRLFLQFSLLMLLAALFFGILAILAFLYPDSFNSVLPFYQLRPAHVSAAVFWIISGAVGGILYYKNTAIPTATVNKPLEYIFLSLWVVTILTIFSCYALKLFGGREYWEFPPVLSVPLLVCWLLLISIYFRHLMKIKSGQPLYMWMWTTGIVFFLITFLEQNLWQISWFRASLLREVTVQWKANGVMVGAWNQMIYGTALFIMVQLTGKNAMTVGWKPWFFYFLGLTNLMFNWGHHIYNLPANSIIRNISYGISMLEWFIFINIIQGFRRKMEENDKLKHLITYRFLIAAEFWVFVNLLLALLMSVPAINRYTHGTHVTVAHAMGTTIGINTMILLGSISFILGADNRPDMEKKWINVGFWISNVSLMVFFLLLLLAGIIKGYNSVVLNIAVFQDVMSPVLRLLKVFVVAGLGVSIGLGMIGIIFFRQAVKQE